MVRTITSFAFLLLALACASTAGAVTFDWATVGNPFNADDDTGFGGLDYTYRISKYEVTNAQYTEFLNAVDPTGANPNLGSDDGFLYDPNMAGNFGGIENTGTTDGDRYVAQAGREQNPVTYVSFFDAMRFTNWLHNGQGSGDTETGVYTIGSGTNETRSAGATFWIPNEGEWYKAAYYDPNSSVYYDYPTGTDTESYSDNPSSLNTPDDTNAGNFFKDDSTANGYDDGHAVSGSTDFPISTNPLTDVGSYSLATSPYGTFDQGGNVWEWNEAVFSTASPSHRVMRGGSWSARSFGLRATNRYGIMPLFGDISLGFRVASISQIALSGDHNGNGTVDAADYVLWRKSPSVFGDAQGYTDWVSNFGQTAGSGAALPSAESPSAAVPEPATLTLLLVVAMAAFPARR